MDLLSAVRNREEISHMLINLMKRLGILEKTIKDAGQLGDKNFIFNKPTASNTWVITHNLNKNPSVTVIDDTNTLVLGAITYNSMNQITISFNGNISGVAYLN